MNALLHVIESSNIQEVLLGTQITPMVGNIPETLTFQGYCQPWECGLLTANTKSSGRGAEQINRCRRRD